MIGLDIDEKSIKLVEIKETPEGYALTNHVIEPGPPTSKTIQKMLKNLAIEEKEAYGVICGKNIVIYPKLFPLMSERELKEAVFWEAKELISYPMEEAVITYDRIGERVEGGIKKLDVILVIFRRGYFKEFIALLEEAGLKVKGLTAVPFALWDLVKLRYKPQKEEIFAILDIGSISASFNLFVGSDLKFTREISVAGETITKILTTPPLDLDYHQAESMKIKYGFPEEGVIREKMQPVLETLSSEVLQTINYIYEKGIAARVDLLLLTGGTSQLKNLDGYLAKNLGVRTQVFNPLTDLEIKEAAPELEASSSRLAVALGLALGKTQSLNILKMAKIKEERAFPKIPLRTLVSVGVLLVFTFSLFFSVNLFFRSYRDNLKKTLTLKTGELRLRQKPKVPEIAKEVDTRAILDRLLGFLPSAFTLEELDYERGKKSITFSGSLAKQEILGTLIYNLQASGKYKEVKLWEVSKRDDLVLAKIGLVLQK